MENELRKKINEDPLQQFGATISLPNNEITETEEDDINVGIDVIVLEGGKLPEYKTDGAAGLDVYARLYDVEKPTQYNPRRYVHPELSEDNSVVIYPSRQTIVDSGIKVNIPYGYEIQVRSRSGLSAKSMVSVGNQPGTVDFGYQDPIGIILINHGNKPFVIRHGDRIAQIVLQQVPRIAWNQVDSFDEDTYNRGGENGAGFGSTGIR